MASSFDSTSHHWSVQMHAGGKVFHGNDRDGMPPRKVASRPECRLEGWFLPAANTEVQGMRVLLGTQAIAVKRKQLRPDILRLYPDHPEALLSGFKAILRLESGLNEMKLQFKDASQQWHDLHSWQIYLPLLWRVRNLWKPSNADAYRQWLQDYDSPSEREREDMRRRALAMAKAPSISVVVNVRNTSKESLKRTLLSVQTQWWPCGELFMVANDPLHVELTAFLEKVRSDPPIRLCGAQDVLKQMKGDYACFVTAGDVLSENALLKVATQLERHPETEILYSDEDKADENGCRTPCFKGGWNPELLLHENCVGHLLVVRRSCLDDEGVFEGEAAEWSLLLRMMASVPKAHVRHLPHVLCQRGQNTKAAPSKEIVTAHLAKSHPKATVQDLPEGGWHIVWPLPRPAPLASIIIPTHNRADLLRVAMDSLFSKTTQPPYEVIVVDHASDEAESLSYFKRLSAEHKNVRVIRAEGPFNWSRLNNLGAREARGDILLFLNNDVEIIDGDWLRELASNACRPDVGAVGACLLYPDGTIQHAGIVLGMTGLAGHVFRTALPKATTPGRPDLPREVTAVTGACLAVRRSVFQDAGGFDEEHLPVSYNDVDFCLRLRARGLRNIYTPFARLIHHESVSRRDSERNSSRKAEASEEARTVLSRWPEEFEADAFFSPNFSLDHEIPTLAFPPRWRQDNARGE